MIRKSIIFQLLAFLILLAGQKPVEAQNVLTPQNIFDLENVAEVSISPDNNYIAFTLNVPRPFDQSSGPDFRELYLFDINANRIMPFITGPKNIINIGWTPSGDAVTFRANFESSPGWQVHAINISGGESYPLTLHPTGVISYEFIDDNSLAIIALSEPDPRKDELKETGFDIEVYEEEWRHRNLYRYNIPDKHAQQLTEGVSVFDIAITPDGRYAAAAIAPHNLVDDSYMFKRIHLVDLQTGETNQIMDNPGKLGKMAFSPNGSKLAFASASRLEDSVVGSLFVMDVDEDSSFDKLRNYVEGMELSVIDFSWKDNNTLLYSAEEGADIVLSQQELDEPSREVLIEPGNVVFSRFDYNNQLVAFAGNTWQHPAELYTFRLRKENLERITNFNKWLENIQLGKQRKLVYTADDGTQIQGVLIYPIDYREGRQYPLITYIHGGPESAVQDGWNTSYSMWGQVAAAQGYFVFMPNYRSSSGRGVGFTMAGYGDLAGTEYNDVLDGIDHLIAEGYVDRQKVGIGGGSYGGYFAAWSATRYSERFAAAVVFVGIANQLSKRNTTDIPWEDYYVHWGFWSHEDYQEVYDRSPVKYAHQSQTPTLILHGTEDPRVHPSQSLELYRSLELHGEAPVRLIWYEGEGHGNRNNFQRLDYIVRTMDWFNYYLKDAGKPSEKPPKYPDYGL